MKPRRTALLLVFCLLLQPLMVAASVFSAVPMVMTSSISAPSAVGCHDKAGSPQSHAHIDGSPSVDQRQQLPSDHHSGCSMECQHCIGGCMSILASALYANHPQLRIAQHTPLVLTAPEVSLSSLFRPPIFA